MLQNIYLLKQKQWKPSLDDLKESFSKYLRAVIQAADLIDTIQIQ